MKDMSVNGVAAAQQNWSREQQQAEAAPPAEGAGEDLSAALSRQEEEGRDLLEMIRDAQEKAEAQREAMKLPKSAARYGDAPLEAYARLARARSRMEVNAASGYARRRLAQFKTALRTDSDNAAKIKAAINQLQKAVNRGERKKRELDREHLTEVRRKRAAKEDLKEKERRLRQELLRRKSQRIIRESGYMREAEISDRLASQLTATQMELRQQAEQLGVATQKSMDAALQGYSSAIQTAEIVDAPVSMPQVDVEA